MEPELNGFSGLGTESISVCHALVLEGATREGCPLLYGWSRFQRAGNTL